MSGSQIYILDVITAFGLYRIGNLITDPATMAAVLAGPDRGRVAEVPIGVGPGAGSAGATGTAGSNGSGLTGAQLGALYIAELQAAAALPSTGGTASGLILSADPTAALGAATKEYVDAHSGGGGSGGGAAFTSTTVTAAGTTQATAAALPDTVNTILSAAPGSGVILPASPTQAVVVENRTDTTTPVTLLVYPPTGAQVNAAGVNLPVQIVAGGSATFTPSSPTQFYSE